MGKPHQLVTVLRDALATVADDYDLDAVLAGLCEEACRLLPVDGAAICLIREDRSRSGVASDERTDRIEALQQTLGEGICHRVVELDAPVVVENLASTEQQWTIYSPVVLLAGMHAVAGIPLRVRARPVGSLDLYRHQPSAFTDQEVAVAEVLADIAAAYVATHRRRTQAEQVIQQLEHALVHRTEVEQAKGLLAAKLGMSVDDAFNLLRRHARDRNLKVVDVARQIVAGDTSIQAQGGHHRH